MMRHGARLLRQPLAVCGLIAVVSLCRAISDLRPLHRTRQRAEPPISTPSSLTRRATICSVRTSSAETSSRGSSGVRAPRSRSRSSSTGTRAARGRTARPSVRLLRRRSRRGRRKGDRRSARVPLPDSRHRPRGDPGPSLATATIALGVAAVPGFVRIARGSALALRETEFVAAAEAVGASDARIVFRHVLPNLSGPLITQTTIIIPRAIVGEATLSFLGLGIRPPGASWGVMLQDANSYIYRAPRLAVYPGVAIAVASLAFILLGDGLRDVSRSPLELTGTICIARSRPAPAHLRGTRRPSPSSTRPHTRSDGRTR